MINVRVLLIVCVAIIIIVALAGQVNGQTAETGQGGVVKELTMPDTGRAVTGEELQPALQGIDLR